MTSLEIDGTCVISYLLFWIHRQTRDCIPITAHSLLKWIEKWNLEEKKREKRVQTTKRMKIQKNKRFFLSFCFFYFSHQHRSLTSFFGFVLFGRVYMFSLRGGDDEQRRRRRRRRRFYVYFFSIQFILYETNRVWLGINDAICYTPKYVCVCVSVFLVSLLLAVSKHTHGFSDLIEKNERASSKRSASFVSIVFVTCLTGAIVNAFYVN